MTGTLDDVALVTAVNEKGRRLRGVDVVLATGCSAEEGERALASLMCDAGGDYVIRGQGDKATVEYVFPEDFQRRARRKRWRWQLRGVIEPWILAAEATMKASAGFVLIISIFVALIFLAVACAVVSSNHRRSHRVVLPVVGVHGMLRDWNDAVTMYWLLGGGNPFFRPIYYGRRHWIRQHARRRQRWTQGVREPEEQQQQQQDDEPDEEPQTRGGGGGLQGMAISLYGVLFGDDVDVSDPWKAVILMIRRRGFVVVPEDLASWLPDPPRAIDDVPSQSAIARFGGSPVAVPDGPGYVLDFRLLRDGQSPDDVDDDFLKEPRRRLFPVSAEDSLHTCAGAIALNLSLWLIVRFAVLPSLKARLPFVGVTPRQKSIPGATIMSPTPPTTGVPMVVLRLLTSRLTFGIATFFTTFAIIFCLLPCIRGILIVGLPNLAIEKRNSRRAQLRSQLRQALTCGDSSVALRKKFSFASRLRSGET